MDGRFEEDVREFAGFARDKLAKIEVHLATLNGTVRHNDRDIEMLKNRDQSRAQEVAEHERRLSLVEQCVAGIEGVMAGSDERLIRMQVKDEHRSFVWERWALIGFGALQLLMFGLLARLIAILG